LQSEFELVNIEGLRLIPSILKETSQRALVLKVGLMEENGGKLWGGKRLGLMLYTHGMWKAERLER
jgi:hypothetical protein